MRRMILFWAINDTLTVLGSANIVAADFANSGTIAMTGSLGIKQLF